jgi:proteasome lid subunit RPN8/RPN11
VLHLLPATLAAIRRHAERSHPREGCGVLLGRAGGAANQVSAALPCANARRERLGDRWEIDPRDLLRIARAARAAGEEIVGFFHSHPDGPARPSATDLAEAHWLGCSFVITAVAGGRAGATRSFRLSGTGEADKRFVEEEIRGARAPRP